MSPNVDVMSWEQLVSGVDSCDGFRVVSEVVGQPDGCLLRHIGGHDRSPVRGLVIGETV